MPKRKYRMQDFFRSGQLSWIAFAVIIQFLFTASTGFAEEQAAHPRLVVTAEQRAELLEKTGTEHGAQILERIRMLSRTRLEHRDRLKEAGYQAAGMAALAWLTEDVQAAEAAYNMVQRRIIGFPMDLDLSLLERSSRLMGAVIAWDFGYSMWDADARDAMAVELLKKAEELVAPLREKKGDPDELITIAWSAAGMCGMALRDQPAMRARADKLVKDSAEVVGRYVTQRISNFGVSNHGEGLKQMTLASGVLPYMHAWRNVYGAFPEWHKRIQQGLAVIAIQTVPGVGIFRFAPPGSAVDRSGLISMGWGICSEEQQASLKWLYAVAIPAGHYDVTRPVQGIFMLGNPVAEIEAARESIGKTNELPKALKDSENGLYVLRKDWSTEDGIAAAVNLYTDGNNSQSRYAGDFRLFGQGGRWATMWGMHANIWGPQQGRNRNNAGFFGANVKHEFEDVSVEHVGETDETLVVSLRRRGSVTIEPERRRRRRNEPEEPEGETVSGAFDFRRSIGFDYSALSGADALIVIVDRLDGPEAAPRSWAMHTEAIPLAYQLMVEDIRRQEDARLDEVDRSVQAGEISYIESQRLRGEIADETAKTVNEARGNLQLPDDIIFVMPEGSEAAANLRVRIISGNAERKPSMSQNPPYWSVLLSQGADFYIAVLTLQEGDAPAIDVSGSGMDTRLKIGERSVAFRNGNVVFE